MKLAEFAALVKASKQAVSKAAGPGGRLRRSVRRDERGRVVDIDRTVGLEEWRNAELPRHPAAVEARLQLEKAPPADDERPLPELPAADVQRLVARLLEVVATLQADEREIVAEALPDAVAAAAGALQRAGYPPTIAQIAEALDLESGADGDGGSWIAGSLMRAIGDEDAGHDTNRQKARRAARESIERWVTWQAEHGALEELASGGGAKP
ncbi:conserved hypothetical protein [Anaeromyxobacter sp. K]|uniref:hypothetical protein n=1 Tax=Anaeromyxobacter sp. (strain K) TaxID=447217 RepID=UPI00015F893A|nr:hypothetical protein [Anaeromyxobacter sp. K]ACG73247.1 conserved hypothetical protein [Anaeromyxobacter sp. K]